VLQLHQITQEQYNGKMHDPVSTKIKENMACRLMGEISSTDKT